MGGKRACGTLETDTLKGSSEHQIIGMSYIFIF